MSFFGVVFVILLVLKMIGLVTIGWLAVFSPLIIAFIIPLVLIVVGVIMKNNIK